MGVFIFSLRKNNVLKFVILAVKALYDDLANKAHKDVWSLLTHPEPAGFYGLQDVCGEVDDGVLALYVLLMRYYPNNNNYCQKLKTFLNNTPLLVQSPRVDVRSVCKEIGPPLKEAIKLGVRVPWDTSGLAFIETLTVRSKARIHAIFASLEA